MSEPLRPHGLQPTRLLCPWDSPGKNSGVGSQSLLQGTFSTQGSNPSLLHCRPILHHLSHQGSPANDRFYAKGFSHDLYGQEVYLVCNDRTQKEWVMGIMGLLGVTSHHFLPTEAFKCTVHGGLPVLWPRGLENASPMFSNLNLSFCFNRWQEIQTSRRTMWMSSTRKKGKRR